MAAVAGLHPATGGSGLELCSGDMLLEALVACAGVTLKSVATAIDAPLKSGTVSAEGAIPNVHMSCAVMTVAGKVDLFMCSSNGDKNITSQESEFRIQETEVGRQESGVKGDDLSRNKAREPLHGCKLNQGFSSLPPDS